MTSSPNPAPAPGVRSGGPVSRPVSRLACAVVQPTVAHVRRVAARHPSLFSRLGAHQATDFVIDPIELLLALHLRPDPQALVLRAVPRDALPVAGATIRGRFLLLLELLDAEEDGDAAFFFPRS